MLSRLMLSLVVIACLAFPTTAITAPLTLPDAIALAVDGHPDLRAAEAALGVARADSTYAGTAAFNPALEIRASSGGQSLGSGTESVLEFGVSQELELGGKRGARRVVAAARSRTSAAEWDAQRLAIESRVRAEFEHALFMQERVRSLDELAELDRPVVRATQARVRDGLVTPVTGRLTELDGLRIEVQVRRARSDFRQAILGLAQAMGRELADSTRLAGELAPDSLQAPEDSVIAVALRRRGEGAVLRGQMNERRAELDLAQREGRPNLTVGAGLSRERRSFAGEDFSGDPAIVGGIDGVSATDNLWTARISLPLPFWQKNQAGQARATAEIARSQATYDRYSIQLRLDILAAIRQFEDATALYHMYLDRSPRVRQDLGLVRGAYTDGRIALDSYLTQKGRLVDTLLAEIEAGDAYWDARGRLEAAAGLGLAQLNTEAAR